MRFGCMAYGQKPRLDSHADVSSYASGLVLASFHLHLYYVYMSSEDWMESQSLLPQNVISMVQWSG